jgi:hypothetical protein
MRPQVLSQALVGRVRLGREDQVGQLVLQATADHGQTVALYPDIGPLLFGAVSALCFFIPGLVYHRRRLRQERGG